MRADNHRTDEASDCECQKMCDKASDKNNFDDLYHKADEKEQEALKPYMICFNKKDQMQKQYDTIIEAHSNYRHTPNMTNAQAFLDTAAELIPNEDCFFPNKYKKYSRIREEIRSKVNRIISNRLTLENLFQDFKHAPNESTKKILESQSNEYHNLLSSLGFVPEHDEALIKTIQETITDYNKAKLDKLATRNNDTQAQPHSIGNGPPQVKIESDNQSPLLRSERTALTITIYFENSIKLTPDVTSVAGYVIEKLHTHDILALEEQNPHANYSFYILPGDIRVSESRNKDGDFEVYLQIRCRQVTVPFHGSGKSSNAKGAMTMAQQGVAKAISNEIAKKIITSNEQTIHSRYTTIQKL